ncbi:MAG: helix-turn-helix domain-containing protein [Guyparkeria sp.]
MSEQERQEPAVETTSGESNETISLGQEPAGPSVGERIRRGREAAGLSAADLAQPLNLDLKVIELVEQDRLDAVPGRPYILAYLRTWAGQLGLDADALIAQYNAQREPEHGGVQGGIHPTLDVMEPKGGGLGRRLLGWLGILILIAIVVLVLSRLDADRVQAWWSDLRGETTESSPEIESAPADDPEMEGKRPQIEDALEEPPAPPTRSPEQAAEDSRSDMPGERLAAIDSTLEPDSEGTGDETSASDDQADPTDDASEGGVNAANDEAAADEDAAAATEEDSGEESRASADDAPALLLRATRADSWVEVRDGNGDRLMYDVLAEGEEREFVDVEGPFSLVIGQPDGLEVEHRGESVELGEPSGATGVLRTTVGGS